MRWQQRIVQRCQITIKAAQGHFRKSIVCVELQSDHRRAIDWRALLPRTFRSAASSSTLHPRLPIQMRAKDRITWRGVGTVQCASLSHHCGPHLPCDLNASSSAMGFRGKNNLDFSIQDTHHSSPVIFARSSTDHPRWTTEAQLHTRCQLTDATYGGRSVAFDRLLHQAVC